MESLKVLLSTFSSYFNQKSSAINDLSSVSQNLGSNQSHQEIAGNRNIQIGAMFGNISTNDNCSAEKQEQEKNSIRDRVIEIPESISYLVNRTEQFNKIIKHLEKSINNRNSKAIVANVYGPVRSHHMIFMERIIAYFHLIEIDEEVKNCHKLKIQKMKRILKQPNYSLDQLLEENETRFDIVPWKYDGKSTEGESLVVQPLYFRVIDGEWNAYSDIFSQWMEYWKKQYRKIDGFIPVAINCIETNQQCELDVKHFFDGFEEQDESNVHADFLVLDKLEKISKDDIDTWVYEQVCEQFPNLNIDEVWLVENIELLFKNNEDEENKMHYMDIREELLKMIKDCAEEEIKIVRRIKDTKQQDREEQKRDKSTLQPI